MFIAQELMGREVLSARDGKKLGIVHQCACDLATGKLVALIVDARERLKGLLAVRPEAIRAFGGDAVLVSNEAALVDLGEIPELELFSRQRDIQLPVYTLTGKRLGSVGRIFLEPVRKTVVEFELSGGPWRDLAEGVPRLRILPGSVHGEDAVLVPAEAEQALAGEAGGLAAVWQRVTATAERLGQVAAERLSGASKPATGKAKAAPKEPAAKETAKAAKAAPKRPRRARKATASIRRKASA